MNKLLSRIVLLAIFLLTLGNTIALRLLYLKQPEAPANEHTLSFIMADLSDLESIVHDLTYRISDAEGTLKRITTMYAPDMHSIRDSIIDVEYKIAEMQEKIKRIEGDISLLGYR